MIPPGWAISPIVVTPDRTLSCKPFSTARAARRRRVGTMPNHAAEPLDEPHARAADGIGQIAEFQVRMGVDQARHDGRLAQVFDRRVARRTADGDNPALGNGYRGVAQRRPGHGKDPAGQQTPRRMVDYVHERQTTKYTKYTKEEIEKESNCKAKCRRARTP